jgi:membrane glycosyltransferase
MALRLAEPHLTGHGAVRLILAYAAHADDDEVPGLTAALGSVLAGDEVEAAAAIAAVRPPF